MIKQKLKELFDAISSLGDEEAGKVFGYDTTEEFVKDIKQAMIAINNYKNLKEDKH